MDWIITMVRNWPNDQPQLQTKYKYERIFKRGRLFGKEEL